MHDFLGSYLVHVYGGPETKTSHALPGLFYHQGLAGAVGHGETNALILTNLGNLRHKDYKRVSPQEVLPVAR